MIDICFLWFALWCWRSEMKKMEKQKTKRKKKKKTTKEKRKHWARLRGPTSIISKIFLHAFYSSFLVFIHVRTSTVITVFWNALNCNNRKGKKCRGFRTEHPDPDPLAYLQRPLPTWCQLVVRCSPAQSSGDCINLRRVCVVFFFQSGIGLFLCSLCTGSDCKWFSLLTRKSWWFLSGSIFNFFFLSNSLSL